MTNLYEIVYTGPDGSHIQVFTYIATDNMETALKLLKTIAPEGITIQQIILKLRVSKQL